MTALGTGQVAVERALLRRVLERLGYSPASSSFGIVSQLRAAVAPRPEPEYAGRVPADVREAHLWQVLAGVLAHHLTERGPAGNVAGCLCGQLQLGQSWSGHVAQLVRDAIFQQPLVQLPVDVQAAVLAAGGITLVAGPPQADQDGDQVGQQVQTETVPDVEAREHPLHPVLAEALRHGMSGVTGVEVHRVWGRWTAENGAGAVGNVWAGTPEDVADSLVRAVTEHLPVLDGTHGVLVPLLPSTIRQLARLTRSPLTPEDTRPEWQREAEDREAEAAAHARAAARLRREAAAYRRDGGQ